MGPFSCDFFINHPSFAVAARFSQGDQVLGLHLNAQCSWIYGLGVFLL